MCHCHGRHCSGWAVPLLPQALGHRKPNLTNQKAHSSARGPFLWNFVFVVKPMERPIIVRPPFGWLIKGLTIKNHTDLRNTKWSICVSVCWTEVKCHDFEEKEVVSYLITVWKISNILQSMCFTNNKKGVSMWEYSHDYIIKQQTSLSRCHFAVPVSLLSLHTSRAKRSWSTTSALTVN